MKKIDLSVIVQGFFLVSDERKATFYLQDIKRGKMNYNDLFVKDEDGRTVSVGTIGIFVE